MTLIIGEDRIEARIVKAIAQLGLSVTAGVDKIVGLCDGLNYIVFSHQGDLIRRDGVGFLPVIGGEGRFAKG